MKIAYIEFAQYRIPSNDFARRGAEAQLKIILCVLRAELKMNLSVEAQFITTSQRLVMSAANSR